MPWMYAINDDGNVIEWKGDSGNLSTAYRLTTLEEAVKNKWEYHESSRKGEVIAYCHNTKPSVGVSMRVGSTYSRSYSSQDYWTTTPVTEILEEFTDDQGRLNVKFKTKNSTYWWKE